MVWTTSKEEQRKYYKKYRKNNKQKILEISRKFYNNHKESESERKKQYYRNNIKKVNKRNKKWKNNNKEKILEYKREYMKKHKDYFNTKRKELGKRNKENLFILLGNICRECKEDNIILLDLEHKNGDGKDDRKKGLKGYSLSNYYLKRPKLAKKKLQLLCVKCHRFKNHREGWNK